MIFSDETRRNPYPTYDLLRKTSPLVREPRTDLVMLFDYLSVKRALTDDHAFSSSVTTPAGKVPDWLVFIDPPRHTKLRALLIRAFSPRAIANLEPRIRALSREILNAPIERGEMDLVTDYAEPLPSMVIAELLGIPLADRPMFMRWILVILNLSYSLVGGEQAARAAMEHAAVKSEMLVYLRDLIEERRRAPKDDLLTRLIEAEVDAERLTPQEILGFVELLLVAGTETTTNLISSAILCLLDNPAEFARLKTSPELMPSLIEEVVRYRSPVQMVFRQTRRDVELHGQAVPAGKFVLAVVGSANRDPDVFQNADLFDIKRDANPHLGFGHGVHFCLGAALARVEARVALTDLLARATGLELAGHEPWEPRKALHVHGPTHLPIRFERGRPLAAQDEG